MPLLPGPLPPSLRIGQFNPIKRLPNQLICLLSPSTSLGRIGKPNAYSTLDHLRTKGRSLNIS
jgi:hypothetical protein